MAIHLRSQDLTERRREVRGQILDLTAAGQLGMGPPVGQNHILAPLPGKPHQMEGGICLGGMPGSLVHHMTSEIIAKEFLLPVFHIVIVLYKVQTRCLNITNRNGGWLPVLQSRLGALHKPGLDLGNIALDRLFFRIGHIRAGVGMGTGDHNRLHGQARGLTDHFPRLGNHLKIGTGGIQGHKYHCFAGFVSHSRTNGMDILQHLFVLSPGGGSVAA